LCLRLSLNADAAQQQRRQPTVYLHVSPPSRLCRDEPVLGPPFDRLRVRPNE
jgi:hypothetical protein